MTSPPTDTAPAPGHPTRVAFLDALRGIAALAVLLAHVGDEISPAIRRFQGTYFFLGTAGVTVFFLCSGFIIPVSIERARSVGVFWVRRIFRLYPLYWINVLLVAAIFFLRPELGPPEFHSRPAEVVLKQLTMFQMALGAPNMIVVYWTLFFEMVFYIVVTALYLLKVVRRAEPIVVGLLIATLLVEVVAPLTAGVRVPLAMVGFLLMMFNGTLLYNVYIGVQPARRAYVLIALSLIVQLAAVWANAAPTGERPMLYTATGWAVGYPIFLAGFWLRSAHIPRWMIFLGNISYSLYLMHVLVLLAVPLIGGPVIGAIIWIALTIVLSTITYRLIEQPAIAMGNRIAGRLGAPRPQPAPQPRS